MSDRKRAKRCAETDCWVEQSTWATFTGLESLKHVHSYGLDVTFSRGVWAVVQVYLQLLLISDEAGFVQTFPLVVGNPCPLWGRANRALLRCLQPPAGRAVSLGHCCPPVELPGKAANPTNFGVFYGARQRQAEIFATPSLSQSSWDKHTDPRLEVTLYNCALPREPSSHHVLWDMGWKGGLRTRGWAWLYLVPLLLHPVCRAVLVSTRVDSQGLGGRVTLRAGDHLALQVATRDEAAHAPLATRT